MATQLILDFTINWILPLCIYMIFIIAATAYILKCKKENIIVHQENVTHHKFT